MQKRIRKRDEITMLKGSYTIEAAVWVSLLIFIFMAGISGALTLYTEIANQEISEDYEEFWAVKSFYFKNGLEGVFDD